jgi:hypothetical protein
MSAFRGHLAPLLAVFGAVIAPAAVAAPNATSQLVVVEVDHSAVGYRLRQQKLVQATVDPGGLEIPATATGGDWLALGFKAGDRVVAQNGSPVGESLGIHDGVYLFDVIRNNKKLVIELIVHPAPKQSKTIDEQQYDKLIDMFNTPELRSTPVSNASGVIGVRVIDTLLSLRLEVDVGDVIHTIDGQPIKSDAELTTAVKNLRVGPTEVVLDRLGRPLTLTLIRKAPIDLKAIKQLTPTKFEVTRAFADAVLADHWILARKLDASPSVKNGREHGFTVYNLQPDAPAAALGIANGDLVLDIDGRSFDNLGEIIDLLGDLQGASSVVVHLERKGKPMAVTYVVK